jgi:hypothetical protein
MHSLTGKPGNHNLSTVKMPDEDAVTSFEKYGRVKKVEEDKPAKRKERSNSRATGVHALRTKSAILTMLWVALVAVSTTSGAAPTDRPAPVDVLQRSGHSDPKAGGENHKRCSSQPISGYRCFLSPA